MKYLVAFALCALAAAFEGLCAGRDPVAQLRATKQPSWSPPAWAWVAIGIGWYAICYAALVRLLRFWPEQRLAVILLCVLMMANGAANLFQFRMRRLDLSFLFLAPYWLVLASFLWAACPLDGLACALFGLYSVYQLYAAAWAYQLWKLNPPVR